LKKAKSWVKELQRQANPNIVIALVGNKIDLVQPIEKESFYIKRRVFSKIFERKGKNEDEFTGSRREVPTEEAKAYANKFGMLFIETSTKEGDGVRDVFTEIGMNDLIKIY
jgi:Ras-related protein Rab-5C